LALTSVAWEQIKGSGYLKAMRMRQNESGDEMVKGTPINWVSARGKPKEGQKWVQQKLATATVPTCSLFSLTR